jgi:hypothetical protein
MTIPASLRRLAIQRANDRCEYCKIFIDIMLMLMSKAELASVLEFLAAHEAF